MYYAKVVKSDDHDHQLNVTNQVLNREYGKSERVQRAFKELQFPQGKRLSLEIEITDETYSEVIHAMLQGKLEGQELLGFKVNAVYKSSVEDKITEELDSLLQRLEELKQSYQGGSS